MATDQEQRAYYLAEIAQIQANIASLQASNQLQESAIQTYEANIEGARAEIERASIQLADADEQYLAELEQSIAFNERVIVENEQAIIAAQDAIEFNNNQITEQEFYLQRDYDALGADFNPTPVDANNTGGYPPSYPNGVPYDDEGNLMPGWELDEFNNPVFVGYGVNDAAIAQEQDTGAFSDAAIQQATIINARTQAQIQAQSWASNTEDWRVRLKLAPGAGYLYNSGSPGILQPLKTTNGVLFPYTPTINTSYTANYNQYNLTHSNYRGYFYQNSYAGEVRMQAVFTAQDTSEANYLLAVIHFFRSITKMFYGQDDSFRGAPPPLVFLQGLGTYQFNNHPCVVSSFDYNLPADVDYIRATAVTNNGNDLLNRRDLISLPVNSFNFSVSRLVNSGLNPGGLNLVPAPPTLSTNAPTYVPTKIEIGLTLLPMQTRSQISKQFSLKQFGNGDLLRGGFW